MAFTWEVEALRKMIEGIVAGTASEYNKAADQLDVVTQPPWAEDTGGKYGIDEPGFVSAEEERKVREALELDPDDPLPDHYEIDQWGNVWDLTIQDELERRALAEEKVAGMESENRGRSPAIDAFLDALSNVPADEAKSRGVNLQKHDQNMDYLRGLGKTKRGKDKFKLDWVNEILKEHAEKVKPDVIHLGDETARERQKDWTIHSAPDDAIQDYLDMAREAEDEDEYWKEYGRLERGIGVSPEVPPFLSYLLRQSPYARLPAAGLLAAGLMGYSKPAY